MSTKEQRAPWQALRRAFVASSKVKQLVVLSVLAIAALSAAFGGHFVQAFAQTPCTANDQAYNAVAGDTLSALALRSNTSVPELAARNHIANPDQIWVNQQLCMPAQAHGMAIPAVMHSNANVMTSTLTYDNGGPSDGAIAGTSNPYPYGQCTYWASERYHQLHGIYVPWSTNADAWQWQTRAPEYNWHVTSQPMVGSIIDLQPWVQGAYDLGHVAVVEQVLDNGHVLASNMNWAGSGANVVTTEFSAGPGVSFIYA